ncbi:hypothetical protein ACFVW8_03195 [Streptomyces sp. NPDC058221]|uniref:hypothetical protein n=1 Tax=Streptomyces sp. NPDC058221 TaxID=3346388 RepID=UPI0036E835E5
MTTTGTLAPEQQDSPTPRPARSPGAYRPTLHVLRTELRRGIAPWTGVCTAVILGVSMATTADRWQGGWGETQGHLHAAASLLAGPMVAAAACWQGAREHRRSTDELWLSTPRARSARVVLAALPVALWAVAGYLLVLAASLLATWPYAGSGSPFPSFAVVNCAFLLAVGLLGFVVGQRCRWRLAAPALAVVLYVVLGVPDYSEWPARYLDPAFQYYLSGSLPVWWFAPAMVAWTGGLGLAALVSHAARRKRLVLVPLAVAAAVAPFIALTGPGLLPPDPARDRLVCTDGTPRVCLNGLDAALLPQASQALSGLIERLDEVPGAPVGYVGHEVREGSGEIQLSMPARGWGIVRDRLSKPEDFVWQAAASMTFERRECPDSSGAKKPGGSDDSGRVMDTDDAVTNWLAGRRAVQPPGAEKRPLFRRLEAMPAPQRRVWLGRYLATRKSCDPSEVPVL